MRTDENVASGDSKLAALMRQGVTVAHIVLLLQEAFPKRWQQHLRNRLGATRPTDLTPAELAEFTDHVFWLVKRTGIRDPAAMLVLRAQLDAKKATAKLVAPAEMADIAAERKSAEREPVALKKNSSKTYNSSPPRPVDLTMTTENPFDGREHDGRVFRDRHERNFFIGRLSPRQKEEWLRDHPDRWQTREEFLRDLQARARTDVAAEPTEPRSTPSATEVPTGGSRTVCYWYRMRTSVSLTSRPPTPRRRRLPILKRPLLRRPLLATRSLSTIDDFSVSVALPKCSAAACGRCNAGARKGKAPRARR